MFDASRAGFVGRSGVDVASKLYQWHPCQRHCFSHPDQRGDAVATLGPGRGGWGYTVHTFCWRQSLHALFTPGWCFALLLGLSCDASSPLFCRAPAELLLRLRGDRPSVSGEAATGEAWMGDCMGPAPGGSKETPLCHAMAASLLLYRWESRCAPVSGGTTAVLLAAAAADASPANCVLCADSRPARCRTPNLSGPIVQWANNAATFQTGNRIYSIDRCWLGITATPC